MAVTIKDIAKKAGVSYSTVSRALNNLNSVNADTRELVVKTAKELGYMPNFSAVNLKRKRTNVIGVYFSTINNMSSPEILHSVVTAIYDVVKENYLLVVKGVDKHVPGTLNPATLDGIINISQMNSDEKFIKEAREKKIPFVLINRKSKQAVDAVLTDEEDSFYRAMKYLLNKGHREIAVLEGPKNLESTRMRRAGWHRAMLEQNLDPDVLPVFEGTYRYESGVNQAEAILATKPTALLSYNDEMAFGVEYVLSKKGLSVPEDLSIVGFDNWNQPMYTYMNLTTIERSMYNLSKEACKLLISRIEEDKDTDYATKTIILESPMIERGSVKDLNNEGGKKKEKQNSSK